jgi:hypothetical protein
MTEVRDFTAAQAAYNKRAADHARMAERCGKLKNDLVEAEARASGSRQKAVSGVLGWLRGTEKQPDLQDLPDGEDMAAVRVGRLREAFAAASAAVAEDRRELAGAALELVRQHKAVRLVAGREAMDEAIAKIAAAVKAAAPAMQAAGLRFDLPSDLTAWACATGIPPAQLPDPDLAPFSSETDAREAVSVTTAAAA